MIAGRQKVLVFRTEPIVKIVTGFCALACIASLLFGCSWYLGEQKLREKTHAGTNRTLVVFLPTIHGKGHHFEKQGFLEAVRERGFQANLKILDVNPTIYLDGKLVESLKGEVIDPAKTEGYETIILVGISLGGHGALLYFAQNDEDVEGVVVFAPFLGGPLAARSIEKAGGLHTWKTCPALAWDYGCTIWKLMKDLASNPETRERIFLGFGEEDRFSRQNRLLGQALPSKHVFVVPGGHDWVSWKGLWIRVLDYFHVKCRASGRGFCFIEQGALTGH